jgi:hypothetical protein
MQNQQSLISCIERYDELQVTSQLHFTVTDNFVVCIFRLLHETGNRVTISTGNFRSCHSRSPDAGAKKSTLSLVFYVIH